MPMKPLEEVMKAAKAIEENNRIARRSFRTIWRSSKSKAITIPPEFTEFAVGKTVKITCPEVGKIVVEIVD